MHHTEGVALNSSSIKVQVLLVIAYQKNSYQLQTCGVWSGKLDCFACALVLSILSFNLLLLIVSIETFSYCIFGVNYCLIG